MHVGSYFGLDPEKLKPAQLLTKQTIESIGLHKAGGHKTIPLSPKDPFWKDNQELYQHLVCSTLPHGAPIYNMWIKYYNSDFKVAGSDGGFFGLHQDFMYERPRNDKYEIEDKSIDTEHLMISNSVILDVSDDFVGGEIVLAGDASTIGPIDKRLTDSRDIMHRLKVIKAKKVGDLTVWNGYTMHGVAEIKKGWRASLIVIKRVPYEESYFRV